MEIRDAIDRALAFESRLNEVKARIAPSEFGWYPWDSFGTFSLLDKLLTGRARFLRSIAGDAPVLDIGCGDGALAFLFESLGYAVHALDNPPSNFNGMRGVRALKRALRSRVRIHAADLDAGFRFPAGRWGLALFFGVLYHLKNPLGVLEALAARARYCLLSTAIARYTPGRRADMQCAPLAYLAGAEGLKGDQTNYWIFSEPALRNLVERAGWEVCDWMTTGDADATLWETERDERVFCLLRSRAFPPERRTQLLEGWHRLENDAWRWTAKRFTVAVEQPGRVVLNVTVPPSLEAPVRLDAGSGGQMLARSSFGYGNGEFTFDAPPGVIEFEVDKALAPSAEDGRERGIVITGLRIL